MIIATHGIVASQILTVPVATAATSVGDTSFTANWNAYSGATYYLLDVSTSSSFSSYVLQNQIVTSNSYNVTGLSSNTTYYYRVRASTTGDADAELFFQRVNTAGGSLTTTEKSAVTTLVQDLKSYSIWTKMKAIYPMVGASADACKQNLKSSSFTGTFSSGWTFASTGVTGNGTSAYMNTGLNASTQLTQNSTHISLYTRTDNNSLFYDMGARTTYFLDLAIRYAGLTYGGVYASESQFTDADSLGFYQSNRIVSTEQTVWKNGVKKVTGTLSSNTPMNLDIYISGYNLNGVATLFSNRQYSFASIGDGLTDTEASDFYTAVQAFQTTLSRNV